MISSQRTFWTVYIFCLAFSSTALLGFGRWGGKPSHMVNTGLLARLLSSQFGFVYIYRVCFHHLGFSDKYWGLGSVLRVTLWFFCPAFPGGVSEVASEFNVKFMSDLLGLFRLISSGVSTLVVRFFNRSYGRLLAVFLVPCYPFVTGALNFLDRKDLWLQVMSW